MGGRKLLLGRIGYRSARKSSSLYFSKARNGQNAQ
jgi:hypothetical protein